MKQFKVYANPQGGYEAVERGWSWNACGFGLFWALSQKMWAVGLGVLGVFIVIWGIAAASMGMEQANLIINVGSVVQSVVFGAYGLKWHQTHFESRGFVFKDTVTAANAKGAIEQYMKNATTQGVGVTWPRPIAAVEFSVHAVASHPSGRSRPEQSSAGRGHGDGDALGDRGVSQKRGHSEFLAADNHDFC
jgi:hypothetical protein